MKNVNFLAAVMLLLMFTTTSCEPEELSSEIESVSENQVKIYSDTGDSADNPIPPKGDDE